MKNNNVNLNVLEMLKDIRKVDVYTYSAHR